MRARASVSWSVPWLQSLSEAYSTLRCQETLGSVLDDTVILQLCERRMEALSRSGRG